MSKACYRITGRQPGLSPFDVYRCLTSIRVETRAAGRHGGTLYYVSTHTEGGPDDVSDDCEIANFSAVNCDFCPGCCPEQLNPNQPCDCINGGCVPKATYNTPGVFPTLAACQSGCAKNSNCTGECVDPAEIAALGQALNTLQSKFCH